MLTEIDVLNLVKSSYCYCVYWYWYSAWYT